MRALVNRLLALLVPLFLLVSGCGQDDSSAEAYAIAVTNSYLECAVRDLWGENLGVLCLAPPGMCPGHFDISPAQVRQLKACKLLLRFDFQQGVEDRLARLRDGGLDVRAVAPTGGLCVPDTYLAVCRQVNETLAKAYPDRAVHFQSRLTAVEERLETLTAELRNAVVDSGVAAAGALSSNHQAAFARWLGLEPIATFIGSDAETVANIDHCLKKAAGRDVRFIIANLQEGTTLAQALADRCEARAVVFGNFPEACERGTGFDRLLRDNVRRLCEAVTK